MDFLRQSEPEVPEANASSMPMGKKRLVIPYLAVYVVFHFLRCWFRLQKLLPAAAAGMLELLFRLAVDVVHNFIHGHLLRVDQLLSAETATLHKLVQRLGVLRVRLPLVQPSVGSFESYRFEFALEEATGT